MSKLDKYYDPKIENQRFMEFLEEIKDLNINFDKEAKIRVYKLWIMGYSRRQIKEWLGE